MQTLPTPHVRVRVRMFETSEGGRQGSTPDGTAFACLIVLGKENFDCRMLPLGATAFKPGSESEALIQFVSPELVMGALREGVKFQVRDGRIVGEGEVLELFQPKK